MSRITVREATPELWPALEDLFGPKGAFGGCWCMWWRLEREKFAKGRARANKAALRKLVTADTRPGLLAFDGGLAVGWCQLTPRSDLPVLERSRLAKRVDDVPVWSVSCFFVRPTHRGKGVMGALIRAAVARARKEGAPALEAYPWDTREKKLAATVYTGIASTFERLGFKTVARRAPHRPVMRYSFARAKKAGR